MSTPREQLPLEYVPLVCKHTSRFVPGRPMCLQDATGGMT
jgi:hypothetical protein